MGIGKTWGMPSAMSRGLQSAKAGFPFTWRIVWRRHAREDACGVDLYGCRYIGLSPFPQIDCGCRRLRDVTQVTEKYRRWSDAGTNAIPFVAEVFLGGAHGVGVNFDATLHIIPNTSVLIGAGMIVYCADAHGLVNVVHIDDTITRRHRRSCAVR